MLSKDEIKVIKETLQKLNEIIGVIAVHSYPGINKEHVEHFGNKIIFQCDGEQFFKYCKDNNIKWKFDDLYEHYIEIDDDIYFTLGNSYNN